MDPVTPTMGFGGPNITDYGWTTELVDGPSIVTDYGSTTDFTDSPGKCFPVDPYFDFTENEKQADSYVVSESLKALMLPILYIILVIGTLGNVSFFYVLVRVPYMRNTTNLILANLAVADIAFIVISVTCYSFYFSQPVRSHYGTAQTLGCIGSFIGQYITYYASLALVTLVSAERYFSICSPLKHRSVNTKGRAVKLVICSWLLSLILSGVAMLRYLNLQLHCVKWPKDAKYANLPVTVGYCFPIAPYGLYIANLTESIPFISAFIANSFMYVGIIRRLSNRPALSFKGDKPASLPVRAQQVRNQVSKMLIANGITFFLCNTPFVGISIAFIISHLGGVQLIEIYESLAGILVISHGMLFVNSAINPFIYNATSSHYRQAFRDAFCCADTSGRPRLDSSTLAVINSSKKSDNKNSSFTHKL
ncbi:allatostatin-A receptor-like [Asterias amurensis]|uniref:allatostatin-A receptor-like n=1 Tax=Asterias amurensis TaxID=7602 RepID=UPI003AB84363